MYCPSGYADVSASPVPMNTGRANLGRGPSGAPCGGLGELLECVLDGDVILRVQFINFSKAAGEGSLERWLRAIADVFKWIELPVQGEKAKQAVNR